MFNNSTSEPYRSVLQAPLHGLPAFSASDISTATTVYGLMLLGSDATTPGQPSIGMTVSSSKGLLLDSVIIAAGKGANGKAGKVPDQAGEGENGVIPGDEGGGGGKACQYHPPASGAGKGGSGGARPIVSVWSCLISCACQVHPYVKGAEISGQPGATSGTSKGGSGGGWGGYGCGCKNLSSGPFPGKIGTDGLEGPCATVGGKPNKDTWGTFSGTAWTPAVGGTGKGGEVGSGGGGGGAGGAGAQVKFVAPPVDWPGWLGTGGGGGGCGGYGGPGGGQGGASIALVLVNTAPTNEKKAISLISGPGGQGGQGVAGGLGGAGGKGGKGISASKGHIKNSACSKDVPAPGGDGGDGGRGGAGSGGAGGNGGPSMAIALLGGSPKPGTQAGIYLGQAGKPGPKGIGRQAVNCKGADGADGLAGGKAQWHTF